MAAIFDTIFKGGTIVNQDGVVRLDIERGAQSRSLPRGRDRRSKKRLKARAAWDYTIGWAYVRGIVDAGREVDPADMPPALGWEAPVWDLYELVQYQWREGFGGKSGLDFGPAIRVIDGRGWDIELALQLLHVIEHEILSRESDAARAG